MADAESHYRQACAARPDSALSAFNRGVALEDQGWRPGAPTVCRRAVKIDPKYAEAHFNLERLREAAGDRTDALQHLAQHKRIRERGA
jgi:tetratricopeptide (TPR) repeat protein